MNVFKAFEMNCLDICQSEHGEIIRSHVRRDDTLEQSEHSSSEIPGISDPHLHHAENNQGYKE